MDFLMQDILDRVQGNHPLLSPIPNVRKHHKQVKMYDYKGRKLGISQLAQIANVDRNTLKKRIENGKSIEEAVHYKRR